MDKKKAKKLLRIILAGCFMIVRLNIWAQTQHEQKPNIILFLVDDMGWEDTSVPFDKDSTASNRKFHTPNMARLAAEGVKFTQAYANCVCTPSRVSLVTGMNEARHRVTNWINFDMNNPPDFPYPHLKFPNWNYNGLSPIPNVPNTVYATPIAEILKEHGYYTIHVGKAHFASFPTLGSDPSNLGYDINIAGSAVGRPKSYLGLKNFGNKTLGGYTPGAVPGLELYHGQNIFLSEALTRESFKAMDNARFLKRPFFLYMAHYAVHAAYQPDDRFYQKYRRQGLDSAEAMYAALLEGMDKSLGDIMDYLQAHDLAKNTIILFMSDNGGLSMVPPRGGKPFTQNYPLKGGKGSAYEGGIREPMIVYWPGITKPNTINTQYLTIEDFFPSILQMAGISDYHTVQKVDGISFVPYLKNPSLRDTGRSLIWHYPNNWQEGNQIAKKYGIQAEAEGMGPSSAIRKGAWKLIYFYGTHQYELYNLDTDIGEQHNLSGQHLDKVKRLSALLIQKLKSENAQFLTDSTTGILQYPLQLK